MGDERDVQGELAWIAHHLKEAEKDLATGNDADLLRDVREIARRAKGVIETVQQRNRWGRGDDYQRRRRGR